MQDRNRSHRGIAKAGRHPAMVTPRLFCIYMALFLPRAEWLASPGSNITNNPNPSPTGNKFGLYCFGAPSGTRTQDPLIKSQLLYQLLRSHLAQGSSLLGFKPHFRLRRFLEEFRHFRLSGSVPRTACRSASHVPSPDSLCPLPPFPAVRSGSSAYG